MQTVRAKHAALLAETKSILFEEAQTPAHDSASSQKEDHNNEQR